MKAGKLFLIVGILLLVVFAAAPFSKLQAAHSLSTDSNEISDVSVDGQIDVSSSADLSVTKTASHDFIVVGHELTYEIEVVNNGPSTAEQVMLRDRLSNSIDIVSTDANCSEQGNRIFCDLGDLNPGEVATNTIVVIPTRPGRVFNQAMVRARKPSDPNMSDNVATTLTRVISPLPNLAVMKTDSPDPVNLGQPLTYNLKVTNNGMATSSNVTLIDRLSPKVTFQSVTSGPGTQCSQLGTSNVVRCDFGDLGIGEMATSTIVVIPHEAGVIRNSARVSSPGQDADLSDNHAEVLTHIINPNSADLEITKVGTPNPVIAGETLTYHLKVTNHGPATSTNVVLTDRLATSTRITFVSATSTPGSCSEVSGFITCTLGDLSPGEMATATIEAIPNHPGNHINRASVRGDQVDPRPNNNRVIEQTRAIPGVPLSKALVVPSDGSYKGAGTTQVDAAEISSPYRQIVKALITPRRAQLPSLRL